MQDEHKRKKLVLGFSDGTMLGEIYAVIKEELELRNGLGKNWMLYGILL